MKHRASLLSCTAVGLLLFCNSMPAAETNTTTTAAPTPEAVAATNNAAAQLLTTQALEQLRRDIEASAARNTAAITSGLAMLAPALDRLASRQIDAVQRSNNTILILAGIFAGVGFVVLMSFVVLLMKALGRFSDFAASANRGIVVSAAPAPAALGPGELVNVNATAVEQASARFQHAIEHLQKRILELEQAATPAAALEAGKPSAAKPALDAPAPPAANISPLPAQKPAETAEAASRVSLLLGKGQALLNLDQADQALECFDEILAIDPNNTEALLRRGLSLEKTENWEKALECYDRALAIDSSLTVAYLYKGGVCNKLQRHREALDSYEHALHTEKRSRAS